MNDQQTAAFNYLAQFVADQCAKLSPSERGPVQREANAALTILREQPAAEEAAK